jgi:hypothetical protein
MLCITFSHKPSYRCQNTPFLLGMRPWKLVEPGILNHGEFPIVIFNLITIENGAKCKMVR